MKKSKILLIAVIFIVLAAVAYYFYQPEKLEVVEEEKVSFTDLFSKIKNSINKYVPFEHFKKYGIIKDVNDLDAGIFNSLKLENELKSLKLEFQPKSYIEDYNSAIAVVDIYLDVIQYSKDLSEWHKKTLKLLPEIDVNLVRICSVLLAGEEEMENLNLKLIDLFLTESEIQERAYYFELLYNIQILDLNILKAEDVDSYAELVGDIYDICRYNQ